MTLSRALAALLVAALAVPAAARPVRRRVERSEFWVPAKRPSPEARKARRTAETLLSLAGDLDNSPMSRQRASYLAAEAFEAAVALDPTEPDLHFGLGVARYYADQWQDSVAAFDQVRKLDPKHPRERDMCFFIAIGLAKLGKDFERIVVEYQRWLKLPEELAAAPLTMSLGLAQSRRSQTHGNLAETYMSLGQLPAAIDHYRRADELSPGFPLNLFGLAVALDRDERTGEARRVMQRALVLDPGMSELSRAEVFFVPPGDVHYYFALGLEVKGDKKAAVAAWRRFLREAPKSLYVARARAHLVELGDKP